MNGLCNIRFKELLHTWSMSAVMAQKQVPYRSKYPMVPVESLLSQAKDTIELNPSEEYKQLTLKTNGGGIVERKSAGFIKTRKQTRVKAGQFLFSKIDARNGAFGIVPKDLDGAVVTAEFPVFVIKKDMVIPEYLLLALSSESVTSYVKSLAQGSTNRKRLDVPTFLKLQIPLPPIEEQKKMLKEYEDAMKQIGKKEKELEETPGDIQKKVKALTGARVEKKTPQQRLCPTAFRTVENWSVDGTLNAMQVLADCPLSRLGDFIDTFMWDKEGGSLRVNPKSKPDEVFHYIGMENVEKGIGKLTGSKTLKGKEIKSSALVVPTNYMLFGKLRPNLNKYWYNESGQDKGFVCSTEFFVFSLKQGEPVAYFECMLSSDFVQEQISPFISGTGLPRINADDFLRVMIPNPTPDVKEQLGKYFKQKQRELWGAIEFISAERSKAKKAIESQIFEQI